MNAVVDTGSDEARVTYHRVYALRTYFMILVGTIIFLDKSVGYVEVVYIKYFTDLERIHKYI